MLSNVLTFPVGARRHTPRRKCSAGDAYDQVLYALLDQQLPAGAALTAGWISQRCGVGRNVTSQVLSRLARNGLIEAHPGCPARVVQSSDAQAQQTLTAWQMAERLNMAQVARHCNEMDVARLQQWLAREHHYLCSGQPALALCTVVELHLHLASMTGNKPLMRFAETVVPLGCLITARGVAVDHLASWAARRNLVAALAEGNAPKACTWVAAAIAPCQPNRCAPSPSERGLG
ncbi:MAG: GntR family transcriptional regulator [Pseudomonas sp.]|nr:GntR family transcriptional regulator [Pseudomonas sp.]